MSIIHDALKKAQSSAPNTEIGQQPATAENSREISPKTALIVMISLSLVVLLALTGLASIGWRSLASRPPTTAQERTSVPVPRQIVTNPVTPSIPTHPPASTPSSEINNQNSLKIEGILEHNGKIVALVDGKIVEPNDQIGSDIVTSVSFSGITLSNGTDVRTIPVNE